MSRKWLAVALVILLSCSSTLLAACTKKEPQEGATATQQSGTPGTGNQEGKPDEGETGGDAGQADPLGKYPETITVTQVLGFSPPSGKVPKTVTPETNGFVTKLKEMLNIEIKYLWTVPSDQYAQKFSLAVASGELPDVMAVTPSEYQKFKEDGLLADLSEAYRKYASPTLKKFVENDGGIALQMYTEADGKMYGLPTYLDPYMAAQILWIRTDWLKNLNLEAPKTIEELEKVAEAFVKDDPDRNGKDDTFGITMNKDLITWGFDARGAFHSMGAYPKAWVKDDSGNLVAGEVQSSTRKALERLQSWYEKGILDKEFAFKNIDQVMEDVVAGKVGISFGEWWYPEGSLGFNKEKDPKAEWIAIPLPAFEGKPGLPLVNKNNVNKVLVANKNMKHPEALVKMANFYNEMYTPEYRDVTKEENGFVWNWFEPRFYNPTEIADAHARINQALKNNDPSVLDPADKALYDEAKSFLAGDMKYWGHYMSRIDENGGWGVTQKLKEQPVVYNEYGGTPTPTMVEKGASLNKLTDETFIKIIVGSAKIEEFDKYVDSWSKLGGNAITEEVNAWYQEQLKKQ